MHEIWPVVAGSCIAFTCRRISRPALKRGAISILVVAVAACILLFNGEQPFWPTALAFDVGLAATGVLGVLYAVPIRRLLERRPSPTSAGIRA